VQRYPTDLTEAEWTLLAPLIPAAKRGGRPRTTDMREVVNAIVYVLRGGCQWRLLPTEFPPHQTVYHYFRTWRYAGVWSGCTTPCVGICARPRAARESPVRGSSIVRR
jgi:putative transposase